MTVQDSARSDQAASDDQGTPVGRRLVLAMLGLGAAGVLAGKAVQGALSAAAGKDPTGLTSLLPGVEGFRYYSVVDANPQVTPAPNLFYLFPGYG